MSEDKNTVFGNSGPHPETRYADEIELTDTSGNNEFVHLPQVLNEEFGLNLDEARRILTHNVRIGDEVWTGGFDVPLDVINDKQVIVHDSVKRLMFTYKQAHDRYFD